MSFRRRVPAWVDLEEAAHDEPYLDLSRCL